jgi:hypothetical protein
MINGSTETVSNHPYIVVMEKERFSLKETHKSMEIGVNLSLK